MSRTCVALPSVVEELRALTRDVWTLLIGGVKNELPAQMLMSLDFHS